MSHRKATPASSAPIAPVARASHTPSITSKGPSADMKYVHCRGYGVELVANALKPAAHRAECTHT